MFAPHVDAGMPKTYFIYSFCYQLYSSKGSTADVVWASPDGPGHRRYTTQTILDDSVAHSPVGDVGFKRRVLWEKEVRVIPTFLRRKDKLTITYFFSQWPCLGTAVRKQNRSDSIACLASFDYMRRASPSPSVDGREGQSSPQVATMSKVMVPSVFFFIGRTVSEWLRPCRVAISVFIRSSHPVTATTQALEPLLTQEDICVAFLAWEGIQSSLFIPVQYLNFENVLIGVVLKPSHPNSIAYRKLAVV